ncbi:MAG: FUSC family protein [Lachnospiraceae bacterium]|nr:FUSC family protein [Lachnospiraceae bacterium]
MKLKYQKIHIGRRTIKTAFAVIVSLIIVSFYGATTSKMIFAMLGAMGAMEPTFQKSVEACLTQIVGMICGVIVSVLLLSLPIHWLVCVGIGIVFIITFYNVFQIHFSPGLPCMIIVTLCTTPDIQPFTYAVGRLWDTAIGLSVGMLINILVLPYDNSLKIKKTIEYLEKEVIAFLEDMFDGDNEYPDTVKMTRTIDDMGSQLGIYSTQWLPFKERQNHQRLAMFQKCQGQARQLLAQMEVLSRMNGPGRLSEENRKFLKDSGAEIKDKRVLDEVLQKDIITNYHVEQILTLRKELMETLEEVSENMKKS